MAERKVPIPAGISLRDWLAGMAMAGIVDLTDSDTFQLHDSSCFVIAKSAYDLADAMLARRQK